MSRLKRRHEDNEQPEANDGPATFNQIERIDSLLYTAAIPPEHEEEINKTKYLLTFLEAEAKIAYLSANQTDPINAGRNYSQTDIQRKLNNEI